MTKARGAADSIGKAGRGASFLLPAFSPYYVPYFPLFLRARTNTHSHSYTQSNTHTYRHTSTYTRVLFPFCPPPRLRRPLVLSSFILLAVLLLPLLIVPHRLRSLRRYCTYVCTRTCVRVPRLNRRIREVSCRTALRSRGERAALYVGERENVF